MISSATMSDDERSNVSRREFLQVSAASLVVTPALLATETAHAAGTTTVAKYIATRLGQHGAGVLFGVPGATCDPLFAAAAANGSGVQVVVTSCDLEAGYAADGYARVRGLGAVAVTYGVGTMSLIGVIGGAFAERSPVVVVNGGPTPEDLRLQRDFGTFFSHSIGRDKTDLTMFREVTEYAERAEKVEDVPRIVDAAIKTALTLQRPVYVEIPKNLWDASLPAPGKAIDVSVPPSGEEDRIAGEIVAALRAAKRPALMLGIEIQRYGLAKEAAALVAALGVPYVTDLLAKSVIPEQTAGFAGVYAGQNSLAPVKALIEESDAVLAFGCVMGRQYRNLVTKSSASMIVVANGTARLGRKPAAKAILGPLLVALGKQSWKGDAARLAATRPAGLSFDERRRSLPDTPASAAAGEPGMTYDATLRAVSDALDESMVVITDTSLSMYPAAELNVAGQGGFLCNGVWQAIGFSVGAAVGVAIGGARRPIVLCGDGGFQMTAQSLSTMAQRKLRCIVLVLDNGHYGIEQWLLDPGYFARGGAAPLPYLALNRWKYADLAKALGFETTRTVETEADLRKALADAKAATGPVLIETRIQRRDLPAQLRKG